MWFSMFGCWGVMGFSMGLGGGFLWGWGAGGYLWGWGGIMGVSMGLKWVDGGFLWGWVGIMGVSMGLK